MSKISFDHQVCFHILITSLQLREAQESDLPFFSRERGSNHAWAEYYLQQNTFRRYYAWADHYLQAVICRSRGGLSASGKEEIQRMINNMVIWLNIMASRALFSHKARGLIAGLQKLSKKSHNKQINNPERSNFGEKSKSSVLPSWPR